MAFAVELALSFEDLHSISTGGSRNPEGANGLGSMASLLEFSCQKVCSYKFPQPSWTVQMVGGQATARKRQEDDCVQCGRDREESEGTTRS